MNTRRCRVLVIAQPREDSAPIPVVALTGSESRRRRLCMSTIRADTSREAEPVSADRSRSLHVCRLPWVNAATHQQRFDELAGQGLRMTWINVSGEPTDARYAAVWVTSAAGAGPARTTSTPPATNGDSTNSPLPAWRLQSSRRADPPTARCLPRCSSIARGAWTARHGLPWWFRSAGHARRAGRAVPACGSVPRCTCDLRRARRRAFCGRVVEAIDGVAASMWLGDADFHQRLFDAQLAGGNRPSSLAVSADSRVLSVFRSDQIGAWTARHRIPAQEYQAEFDRQVQQGHRPIVIAAGGSGNDARYAAVFAGDELATSRQWTVTIDWASAPAVDAALDAALADTMRRFGVRSAAIAVARAGDVRVSRGYTWAEPGYAVTQPSALFRQASVSKLFTAAAAQALHDDGVVGLDTPLLDALGAGTPLPVGAMIDPRLNQVTVRQAATRLSGMRRDLFGALPGGATGDATMRDVALIASRPGAPTQDDVVRYVTGMQLATNPGTQIGDGYSNIAFFLLGAAVERAAGKSLNAYIRDRLLREFGVSDFVVARTGLGVRQVGEVSGYDSVDAGPSMLDTSGVWAPATYGGSFVLEPCPGAGGFATSVTTVARFIGSHAAWDSRCAGAGHSLRRLPRHRDDCAEPRKRAGCGDRVQLLGARRGEGPLAGSDRTDSRCCDDSTPECGVQLGQVSLHDTSGLSRRAASVG